LVHLRPTLHRSSMHCLTVAVDSNKKDKKYIKKYLKPFLQSDGSYKIEITLKDDLVDEGSFTIRHYIPHYSIHDKLMYAFATIIQHYQSLIQNGPNKPYPYSWIKDEKKREENLKRRQAEYLEDKAEWEASGLHAGNVFFIEKFESIFTILKIILQTIFAMLFLEEDLSMNGKTKSMFQKKRINALKS